MWDSVGVTHRLLEVVMGGRGWTVLALVVGGLALASCASNDVSTTPTGECPIGFESCDGSCTATSVDPGNCGGCGNTCSNGQVCSQGACAESCGGGTTECDGVCADTNVDPANCGSCGNACTSAEVCSAGSCGTECTGGTIKCVDKCVDSQLDPAHCGMCDNACAAGEVCSAGSCGTECSGGTTQCAGKCVDLLLDPANCGICGTGCAMGEVCSAGMCGLSCGGGSTECNGLCVDTMLDPANCGMCGNACAMGEVCSAGMCGLSCGGGSTNCNGVCVDTDVDPANCGGCGTACGSGEVCAAGICQIPVDVGMVGHWTFDEGMGATAADSSGNGNDGTLTGGAVWAPGKTGTAVQFDGSNDYVQVGDKASLKMLDQFTITTWVRPTGNTSGIFVNKEGEYEIARFADGTIRFAIANAVPSWKWINTSVVMPLNTWTHVGWSYSAAAQLLVVYVDGTKVFSVAGSGNVGDAHLNEHDVRFGSRQCCGQFLTGAIDEVRIYTRALAAFEVKSLYDATK